MQGMKFYVGFENQQRKLLFVSYGIYQVKSNFYANQIFQLTTSFSMEPTVFSQQPHVLMNIGRWSPPEYEQFILLYDEFGKDWKAIAARMKTRTPQQVRSHAQKYLAKKFRIQKEQQEVKEAAQMIPDSADKRLTRKKTRRINYKQRDENPDSYFVDFNKLNGLRKSKEGEKSTQENSKKFKTNIGLQTDLVKEQANCSTGQSLPFFFNFMNPWIYNNNGIWVP